MSTRSVVRLLLTVLAASVVVSVLTPALSIAARGDCGQPVSDAPGPIVSDCLAILGNAIGIDHCEILCVCDTDGSVSITVTDALLCLMKAVGRNVELRCPQPCPPPSTTTTVPGCENHTPIGCPGPLDTCTSLRLVAAVGSELDAGWTGLAHDRGLSEGAGITVAVQRRCVDDPETRCVVGSDCHTGSCRPFCDCDDPSNSVCEITGPTHQSRCLRDLAECDSDADCGAPGRCKRFFGPPLPLSVANTPACITTYFEEDIIGTADAETGEGRVRAFLRSLVNFGSTNDKPCPSCGSPNQAPEMGDVFICDGGPNHGQPCTVEGVSPAFGGVSSACPPQLTLSISGEGIAVRFLELTTSSTKRTAALPCLADGFCIDDGQSCSSNTDCLRCTSDLGTCASNADCGSGTCDAAPSQPISCGFHCHCGFCDNDPSKPCFGSEECEAHETCVAGNSFSGEQDQPNACINLICTDEECCNSELDAADCPASSSTPLEGSCTTKPFISCSGNSSDPRFGVCQREGGGTCRLDRRACFEHTISRTGEASPLGRYCVDDPTTGTCTTNADCVTGACQPDTSKPTTVALFCVPKTGFASMNAAGGLPGPAAVTFKSVIFACRCGDGVADCDEQCDDGNNWNGDGCDEACRVE